MDKLKQMLSEVNQTYEIADHLAYTTYPVVGEVKLLIVVAENIYKSMRKGVEAILYYDRLYKKIPLLEEDFETELNIFSRYCSNRYGISREYVVLLNDLRMLIDAHKKSPIEFARKDKLIICSPSYKMNVLNIKKVKEYLQKSKGFINKINQVLVPKC